MTSEAEEKALRYRRAQSVTRAEEITEKEKKARKSQPDRPIHTPRDSLFSWSSDFDNFTGLVNWGFLMLSIGGVRLFLENLLKYGIRVDPIQWFIVLTGKNEGGSAYPSFTLLIYTVVPVVICLLLEKGISLSIIPAKHGIIAHIANILALVVLPVIVIHYKGQDFSLVGSMSVCMVYLIIFLKLWSYVHVNHWCRNKEREAHNKGHLRRQSLSAPNWIKECEDNSEQSREDENNGVQDKENGDVSGPTLVQYPDNLTLRDLYYFLLAPTLCYELNFPRTSRIRKRFLIKRILEVVLGAHVAIALFQQWMIPSVKNSLVPFSHMDYMRCAERLLKLAVPNHLMWLCFFYLNFHSFLNLMGELMHFADRTFYMDWWNANNIDTFWRTWNMPVHRWAVRHLYIPIVESGYSKNLASMTVFFISAFFHEYLVSVPLQTFKVWAFMGMMAQLPLSGLSRMAEKKLGPRTGNLIVWSSIILGQPLAIMMYYHDYMIQHYSLDEVNAM